MKFFHYAIGTATYLLWLSLCALVLGRMVYGQ